MKTHRGPRATTLGIITALLIAVGAPAASAQPTFKNTAAEIPEGDSLVQEYYFTGSPERAAAPNARKVCTFVQRVDYAHISSTSSNRAVQSHENWGNVNCDYASAVVTTMVQKKNVLGLWVDVGSAGQKTLPPSTHLGSANRVTAHYDCSSSATHTFRSWTDVDVIGIADLPNKQYSPGRELGCN